MKKAEEAHNTLWELYNLEEGWKWLSGNDYEEGVVHSIMNKKYGKKIFKIRVSKNQILYKQGL